MGRSQDEMAHAAGIPLGTYRKYETEGAEGRLPGAEALAALAKAGVNLADLLIPQEDQPPPGALVEPLRAEEPRAGYVYVPLYNLRAAAGPGRLAPAEVAVENELAFREDWIRHSLHVSPADLGLAHVEGDSGEPDLRSGDIILFNRRDTSASREGLYLIRMDDALLVKQLQRLPGGVIKATSRNPAYEPFTIAAEKLEEQTEVAIIGRVVWACRRF